MNIIIKINKHFQLSRDVSSLIILFTPFADTFYFSRSKIIRKCLQNALSEVMDQSVSLTVVRRVWVMLHVTDRPGSVKMAAMLGTLEICVKQV